MSKNNKGFKNFLCSSIGKILMIALFYVLFFGVFMLMVGLLDEMAFIAFIYLALFCYFGWKALNVIQPNVFLIMPIGGWIIYYVVKGILSIFIGIFVAPLVIANNITNLIQRSLFDTEA